MTVGSVDDVVPMGETVEVTLHVQRGVDVPADAAILRELVPWRDGVARELDRSTFRVVSNDVLLEIARGGSGSSRPDRVH